MVELIQEKEKEEKLVSASGESDAHLWSKYRTETQNHAKRIKDLIALAQDSRVRIDALLGRRTRARSDLEDNYQRTSTDIKRGSVDNDGDERRRSSEDRNRDRSYGVDRREDSDRNRSYGGVPRRESYDADRNRSYGKDRRESRDSDHDKSQNQSERIIISSSSPAVIEVGGVSLTNKEFDIKPNLKESNTNNNAPPVVAKKPALAKSPFKFGTVSLQVKLED